MAAPFATGLTFGSALTLSGVASPSVIISQLQLTDFHMLLAFMSASACSAVIVALSNRLEYAPLGHRKNSVIGLGISKFEGNIVGGALQGIGMALTGACPGTVLVQSAAGVGRGALVMLGGSLGGVVFVKWNKKTPQQTSSTAPTKEGVDGASDAKHTIMQKTGLSVSTVVLGYEIILLAAILAGNYLAPLAPRFLNPVVGGVLIGAAQATSVLFSKKTLGVSSAYEDVGKWFWSLVESSTKRPSLSNVIFAAGVAAGAKATMLYVPATFEALASSQYHVSALSALVGGFAMIFGGRLAGGCTSGHGISGMATMSFSSFVTVASMFGAGIATASVLRG